MGYYRTLDRERESFSRSREALSGSLASTARVRSKRGSIVLDWLDNIPSPWPHPARPSMRRVGRST